MKIHKKIRKGFTLVELLVVIAIMASLGAVGYVGVLAFMNAGDKQAAGTNMKQVGTALTNFKRSNGSFPCDQTVSRTEKSAGSYGDLQGDTANDYFRQLFAKRDAIAESNFYAALPGMIEGDNKVANFHLELEGFGGSPVTLDARLSVIDSPNSAGVVIDAIRYLKVARELGITGSLHGASAFTQKTPPYPMTFEDAQYECRMLANRKLTKLTQRQANRRRELVYQD